MEKIESFSRKGHKIGYNRIQAQGNDLRQTISQLLLMIEDSEAIEIKPKDIR